MCTRCTTEVQNGKTDAIFTLIELSELAETDQSYIVQKQIWVYLSTYYMIKVVFQS